MLNDMAWRKTPRDLLTNPKIRTIAQRVRPDLRQAVFAFYAACYMQADDDGLLDVSDTEVFADLLFLENENDIAELTALFIKRGFFEALNEDQTLLYIKDWDNPNQAHIYNGHRVAETADERRARVMNRLKGGKKKSPKKEAPEPALEENAGSDSFCNLNDKNLKSVETETVLRDKNLKSVEITEREEREEKRDIETIETRDIETGEREKTHTHTESAKELAGEALRDTAESPDEEETEAGDILEGTDNAEGTESTAQTIDTRLETSAAQWSYEDTKKAAKEMNIPEKAAAYMTSVKDYESWRAAGVFYAFFVKNGTVGLNTELQLTSLELLVSKCSRMEEVKNPSYIIAGALCKAFSDLVNQRGSFQDLKYFKGMLVTPENFLKPSVFPRILLEARSNLNPGKTAGEKWTAVMQKYISEREKDAETYNRAAAYEAECKAEGIDPQAEGSYNLYCASLARKIKARTG